MTASGPGLAGPLVAEFPDWQISAQPGGLGVWTAYWASEDGRHRRYLVAPTPGELLAALRAVRAGTPEHS